MCRGDSGSSLLIQHEPEIDTIEAVISGGVGACAEGFPRWWIKVSAYRDWITCIMDRITKGESKKAVEKFCNFYFNDRPGKFPEDNKIFE